MHNSRRKSGKRSSRRSRKRDNNYIKTNKEYSKLISELRAENYELQQSYDNLYTLYYTFLSIVEEYDSDIAYKTWKDTMKEMRNKGIKVYDL